jgi:hypothetical protein
MEIDRLGRVVLRRPDPDASHSPGHRVREIGLDF